MPAFIVYVYHYRKIDEHGRLVSIWSFVVMLFWLMRLDFDMRNAFLRK